MSEARAEIVRSAAALFASAPDWPAIAAAGFPLLLVPEAGGGFGGDWGDAFAVLRLAGGVALAQPLGEAMLAGRLVAGAGRALPPGLGTIGIGSGGVAESGFTGRLAAVPWGRDADWLVASIDGADGGEMLLLGRPDAVHPGASPAGEPRDTLVYADAAVTRLGTDHHLLMATLLRVAQAAGALDAALALAVAHVNSREQFGKPLARLQAVQQALAVLAEEAAAVNMAGAAAARALDAGGGALELMAAKLRTDMAIERGVAIAHQVHGAIGFTQDYPLHPLTRRLMGWRSDFGGERWAGQLGRLAMALGGDALWAEIARRGDD